MDLFCPIVNKEKSSATISWTSTPIAASGCFIPAARLVPEITIQTPIQSEAHYHGFFSPHSNLEKNGISALRSGEGLE